MPTADAYHAKQRFGLTVTDDEGVERLPKRSDAESETLLPSIEARHATEPAAEFMCAAVSRSERKEDSSSAG